MGLRLKFTLYLAPILLLVLVGFNLLYLEWLGKQSAQLQQWRDALIASIARQVADTSSASRNAAASYAIIRDMLAPLSFELAVVDGRGNPVLSSWGYEAINRLYADRRQFTGMENTSLQLLHARTERGNRLLFYSWRHRGRQLYLLAKEKRRYRYAYVFLAGLICGQSALILFLLLYLVERNLLAPIRLLQTYSEHIRNGRFDTMLGWAFHGDELDGLYGNMQTMSRSLAETRHRLEAEIHARDQLNSRLMALQNHLIVAERFSLLGQLSASVAHEIGNPLNGLTGYVDMLKLELSDRPECEEYISGMDGEIRRIEHLISHFLHSLAAEKEPVARFRPLLEARSIIALLEKSGLCRDKGLSITCSCSRDSQIFQYREFFRHIVFNLLSNAIAFSPANGVIDLRITYPDNETMMLQVEDQGPGIAEAHREAVFEFAYSGRKGKGFGLYLSRLFAHNMAGTLHVGAAGDRGSCFVLTVPRSVNA